MILAIVLVPVVAAFVILYGRIATVASIEKIDGDFYRMTYKQDYYLEELLEADLSDFRDVSMLYTHKLFFGLADSCVETLDFGCCSFLAKTPEGRYIAGRNYDYADSGELIFYTTLRLKVDKQICEDILRYAKDWIPKTMHCIVFGIRTTAGWRPPGRKTKQGAK